MAAVSCAQSWSSVWRSCAELHTVWQSSVKVTPWWRLEWEMRIITGWDSFLGTASSPTGAVSWLRFSPNYDQNSFSCSLKTSIMNLPFHDINSLYSKQYGHVHHVAVANGRQFSCACFIWFACTMIGTLFVFHDCDLASYSRYMKSVRNTIYFSIINTHF